MLSEMTVPSKLAGFAAILAVAFGGATVAGAVVGPGDERPRASIEEDARGDGAPDAADHGVRRPAAASERPGG